MGLLHFCVVDFYYFRTIIENIQAGPVRINMILSSHFFNSCYTIDKAYIIEISLVEVCWIEVKTPI